ncbi:hypothetical protein MAIT1_02426 [Magnetofaba australis IT-1]|uniref:Sulfotransferase n=2 Tax=Magnetofaba TaxID=1472292 RepID=A0A1Y2K3Q0_9PROT|nr:hypothetical protein MAIT1_02426 [Magnetofaba australis IT-1]
MLAQAFPEARFVLTIRDPRPWLESELNQNLITARTGSLWEQLEARRYAPYPDAFTQHDQLLSRLPNVRPITAYLSYWREHIETVLNAVPTERLLLLRTERIGVSLERLATFLNIDTAQLNANRSHAARGKHALPLASVVPEEFIQDCIAQICQPLLTQLQQRLDAGHASH